MGTNDRRKNREDISNIVNGKFSDLTALYEDYKEIVKSLRRTGAIQHYKDMALRLRNRKTKHL